MKVCFPLDELGAPGLAFINNWGFTHVYYYGPEIKRGYPDVLRRWANYPNSLKTYDPKCTYIQRCLVCEHARAIESDPDERIMPHDYTNALDCLGQVDNAVDEPIRPYELYCTLCGALWDPVPEGKMKLV
jgi:hypothetical protein